MSENSSNEISMSDVMQYVVPITEMAVNIADSLSVIAKIADNNAKVNAVAQSFRENLEQTPNGVINYLNSMTVYFEDAENALLPIKKSSYYTDEMKDAIDKFAGLAYENKLLADKFVEFCKNQE